MFESITPWVITALFGGAAAAVFALKKGNPSRRGFVSPSIKDLVKTQIVDSEFDGRSLLNWVNDNKPTREVKVLLVKPTAFWINKFGLKDAEAIDVERNLIGCIIDIKKEEVLKIQLFSFSTMSDTMQAKFGDGDRIVLTT